MYQYKCNCGNVLDLFQHMDEEHLCTPCGCGDIAQRVWTAPYAAVDNTEPHFNNGLGCKVNSKNDIAEAKRRYTGETGGHLHELGTESSWRAKRKRTEYPSVKDSLQLLESVRNA